MKAEKGWGAENGEMNIKLGVENALLSPFRVPKISLCGLTGLNE